MCYLKPQTCAMGMNGPSFATKRPVFLIQRFWCQAWSTRQRILSNIWNWWRSGLKDVVDIVGHERVIAGSDCGFGAFAGFGTADPNIAYAKLSALAEGAALVKSHRASLGNSPGGV